MGTINHNAFFIVTLKMKIRRKMHYLVLEYNILNLFINGILATRIFIAATFELCVVFKCRTNYTEANKTQTINFQCGQFYNLMCMCLKQLLDD